MSTPIINLWSVKITFIQQQNINISNKCLKNIILISKNNCFYKNMKQLFSTVFNIDTKNVSPNLYLPNLISQENLTEEAISRKEASMKVHP